jgi:geranylgeranyl diphosphate synthase type II
VNLDALMKSHASRLVEFLSEYFKDESVARRLGRKTLPTGLAGLLESIRYSTVPTANDGGKRFRPVLAMLTAEALGQPAEVALPVAAAVECIHTYSLIHDDLPAMDNDDFRRGAPTNHKKFGESTAILAGDALLTEAFLFISEISNTSSGAGSEKQKEQALRRQLRVISELSKAAGMIGMVGGQAVDMKAKVEAITLDDLRFMHRLKTGALICVSAVGAAILAGASEEQLAQVRDYADNLGLAFQVADDLLDYDPAKIEPGSYPALLGPEKTRAFLVQLTEQCLASLQGWSASADALREIASYNQTRTK